MNWTAMYQSLTPGAGWHEPNTNVLVAYSRYWLTWTEHQCIRRLLQVLADLNWTPMYQTLTPDAGWHELNTNVSDACPFHILVMSRNEDFSWKQNHSQVNPMRIEILWDMSCLFLCVYLFIFIIILHFISKSQVTTVSISLLLKRMCSFQKPMLLIICL